MKKTRLHLLLGAVLLMSAISYVKAATIQVTGHITSNTTWTNENVYLLMEDIIVRNGATLTIQPGTLIKGFSNALTPPRLVIATGAKINAQGTPEQPIVFTSDKPIGQRRRADWAGIAICGLAPCNYKDGGGNSIQGRIECGDNSGYYDFGGNNADDSSGVLSYVRIEYAGYTCGTNTELNSLTMGGVGRKTKIDHVQVSYGQDDGFEWFGGTAGGSHLISYALRDDDFDTDNGWSGKVQHGLVIRIDTIADQGDISNAFESDNDANGTANDPLTQGVFSNITVVGPAATASSTIDAKYGWCARLRRNTSISIYNSAFIGYKRGLRIEGSAAQTNASNGGLNFKYNVIAGSVERYAEAAFDSNYIANAANNVKIYGGNANDSVKLVSPYGNPNNYNFTPASGSPLLSGADFSAAKLSGFTSTNYRGAFGTDNWASCWAEFSPQDENYTTNPINYSLNVNITQTGSLPTGVTLTADNISGATYNWSTGATTQAITVTNAASYTVTVTSARGCQKVVSSNVSPAVGLQEMTNISNMNLVPNPNQGFATLEISTKEAAEVAISVVDITGKELLNVNRELFAGRNQVSLVTSSFSAGIYFVYVKDQAHQSKAIRMVVSQ